jgi:predicted RNA-binding Zn-ribbon protein involved in translation (DUF1610 family)
MTDDTGTALLCPQCGHPRVSDASAYNAAVVWVCLGCGWQKGEIAEEETAPCPEA